MLCNSLGGWEWYWGEMGFSISKIACSIVTHNIDFCHAVILCKIGTRDRQYCLSTSCFSLLQLFFLGWSRLISMWCHGEVADGTGKTNQWLLIHPVQTFLAISMIIIEWAFQTIQICNSMKKEIYSEIFILWKQKAYPAVSIVSSRKFKHFIWEPPSGTSSAPALLHLLRMAHFFFMYVLYCPFHLCLVSSTAKNNRKIC